MSAAIYIVGLPESPVRNIRLYNINAIGRKGLVVNNVDGLALKNLTVTAREGESCTFGNVSVVSALQEA